MRRLLRHVFALPVLAAALAAAACTNGTDVRPPVPPDAGTTEVKVPVDPVIEKWFREALPASGMRIMAGDQISIQVQGHADLAVSRYVPPDGTIPLYRAARTVNALSKTPQELESAIAAVYAAELKDPYVTVSIEAPAPRSIYVLGGVKSPGVFPVSGYERLSLLQALTMAGGASDQADLRSVTIRRVHPATGRTVSSPLLDLMSAMERGDERDNLQVEPGDTIVVPDAQELRVTVLGHVEKPGAVTWYKGMTLSRAITESGGFKRFAKTGKIKIVRRGKDQMLYDFDQMLDGKVPDLELEPKDVVYVDERWL
jgi:polysaccharide export outer membrane protein